MEKEQKREEKGITLVALVVTIIVLIILAGVTLNIVLDNDGIVSKTKEATEEYENAQRGEQELLGVVEDYIEYAGKTAPIPEGYTASQITTEDSMAEGLVIYEIPEGATVDWENQTITIEGSTTNLQETVDQYVWIPVDDINSMVMCRSNSGDRVCNLVLEGEILKCTTHTDTDTSTDLVGRLYTSSMVNPGNNICSYEMDFTKRDQIFNEADYHEPAILTDDASNSSITIEQLKDEFKIMATSVAKNGGFYISRYEVGRDGESKKGQPVLTAASSDNVSSNYLGANTWYGLYDTLRDLGNNQQMIWGCQYDQVIKFVGEESEIGHADKNLTETPALSGENELDKLKNVYDIEGNHIEWILEARSANTRTGRGNNFFGVSINYFNPASGRYANYPTYPFEYCSSRSTIYI